MPDILHTPWWISLARGFQVFFALVVFALAATIIHDVYLEELGLCIATGLITWLVTAYLILSEKKTSLQHLYHIIAVMCLEAFMLILWLATFAATAARRAGFVYNVTVDDCYNDGSTVNSSHCSYLKRSSFLSRRAAVLFKAGQGIMSGAAGLGALVWLLYILTFVWTVVMFLRGRKEGRFTSPSSSPSQDHQLEEAKTETVHLQQSQAPPPPQQQQQQQQQQQPPMNQYAQQPHPQQQYVQRHEAPSPVQHQYPPAQMPQPYTPSPDTHYAATAPTTSPSPPSEVAAYGHHHQSELASPGSHAGYPVQMPTYDEHYHQTEYAQQHAAELPETQATYTPGQDQGYHPPQQ